jgi:outer membrane autotransporter protein
VNYSLNQDAKLFGKNGLHMSVGSRLALVDNSREVGSIFKLAYRGNDHFRIGAFIDYGFGDDLPNNFQLKRTAPLASIFAVLSEDKDDIGLSLRLAASYNSSNLDVSRSVLTNTEAGKGRTNLISKGVLVQVGYGFKLNDVLKLQPYAGVRFSEISRNAYTETSGADFPITFAKARKKSTTALLGLNFEMALTQKLSANLGAGFERDLSASLDGYAGNISYLGSFDLTPKTLREKRYFSNVGLGYKITPNQEVAFSVNYTKQSLASSDAVVAYFNYSVGF